jgi:hypothetical protein
MSWGSAIRTRISDFKDLRDCRLPHSPSRAACRSRTCHFGGTGSALWPDELTRRGTQRRTRTGTTVLLKDVPPAIGLAGHGASGRPRTACLLRTKETLYRMSYRGMAPGAGVEPTSPGSGPGILPLNDPGLECGRCDSNAHAAKSEFARSAGCHHSRKVRRQGLEPRLRHRLRACRSTIELAARGAVPGSRTPMICLEGKCLPVRPVRRGGSRRYRTFLLQVFGPALIRLS